MRIRHVVASGLVLLTCGCGVLTSYPERTDRARRAFAAFDFDAAVAQLEPRTHSGNDRLCYLLETATVRHVQGHFDASTKQFFRAEEVMRDFDDRAAISLRDTAAGGAAFLVNDKTMPYAGEGFEKVMLHAYLALNYLLQKNLSDARVEIRRAYQRQKEEAERKERRLEIARKHVRKEGMNPGGILAKIRDRIGQEAPILASAGNVYQNAFAYYLSALVYEMVDEPGEAYVDLKKIHQYNPGLQLVRRDLLRLSRDLGRSGDYRRWRRKFRVEAPKPPPNTGEVVLIHHCGEAPRKEALGFMFPIPCSLFNPKAKGSVLVAVSVPKYVPRPNPVSSARLKLRGRTLGKTETFADFEATAMQYLRDRMPAIVVRQLVRALGKAAAQYHAGKRGGPLAQLLAMGYTAVSEQADLRSWLTLPARMQLLRVRAPAGKHKMQIQLLGAAGAVLSEVATEAVVKTRGICIINLRSVGGAGRAAVVSF